MNTEYWRCENCKEFQTGQEYWIDDIRVCLSCYEDELNEVSKDE